MPYHRLLTPIGSHWQGSRSSVVVSILLFSWNDHDILSFGVPRGSIVSSVELRNFPFHGLFLTARADGVPRIT